MVRALCLDIEKRVQKATSNLPVPDGCWGRKLFMPDHLFCHPGAPGTSSNSIFDGPCWHELETDPGWISSLSQAIMPTHTFKPRGNVAAKLTTGIVFGGVPREELWYCMRKSGVAEKYVRVVQDMYERSRTVRCAVGQTEEFNVEVELHQGLALSPFLFAIVMDQLSEEVRQESPWTLMFADDIVICSESREQVEENLERWRFALERRGIKVSRSKTEYMCVNEREVSGTVRLQGEEVKKVQEFKYLGSTVQSNGECAKEVKKRVQAGWNGWRKVSGVLCDRKISARIKGKVYRTVVRPAMLYGLETVSLRKRQESELEVAELKMLRFSLGVTRLDRIRNEYIRVTAHVECALTPHLNLFPSGKSQTVVVGGLWNCQSAVRKADFISALASHYSFDFLALTETWIPPQNTATPAALSSAYTFSHSPQESGRGGGTGLLLSQRWCNFLDEMDTLLSVFPSDSTPLTVLGDFNLPSDKLHSSGLLALLNSFSLSFNSCPPTHKEGNGSSLHSSFSSYRHDCYPTSYL
ncbi:hypothetical protein QTP70_017251 [Hemibagrus guttatus]|uniref:ribonuclease H n=1 Tax=Hemibagrus guttatus TaxID=175788 RepID=A0AAE0PQJ6_9TELE|nr:hypothetical protein QTP70_017251 [Hemibagrus guttatus]